MHTFKRYRWGGGELGSGYMGGWKRGCDPTMYIIVTTEYLLRVF